MITYSPLETRFPFARLTLGLAVGIWTSYTWPISVWLLYSALGLWLCLSVLSLVVPSRTSGLWIGPLGLLGICLLGYLRGVTDHVYCRPTHFLQCTAIPEAYEAVATEDSVSTSTYAKVTVRMRRVRISGQWQWYEGKVLLYLKPSDLWVRYGDSLLIKGSPKLLACSGNPHAFDYAALMARSHIYHQHFLSHGEVKIFASVTPSMIRAYAFCMLRYCQSILRHCISHSATRAVIEALVLGQKHALHHDIQSAYAHAGTIHILAVSGLHVGVVYSLLSSILYRLLYWGNMRKLASVMGLVLLWFYALLTGLSPSVLRATVMFTYVALANYLRRETNVYQTLSVSAFLLLFLNPSWLFSAGFQLSYLAVLGIVCLQPILYSWVQFSNRRLDQLWMLTAVSIGAQLATFPLSIYYFHYFPSYFLLANWVVVPAASVVLSLGIVLLLVGHIPILNASVAGLLHTVVLCMNTFTLWIQQLPCSTLGPIYLSCTAVVLIYIFLLFLVFLLYTKRRRYLVGMGMLSICATGYTLMVYQTQRIQRKVIFYSIGHHQVINFIQGTRSVLCVDARFKHSPAAYARHVLPSQTYWGITAASLCSFVEAKRKSTVPVDFWHDLTLFSWVGRTFILLDKPISHWPLVEERISVDVLVVENNAVIDLQPLFMRLDINQLIIGASNDDKVAMSLKKFARQHGIAYHDLQAQGALMIPG